MESKISTESSDEGGVSSCSTKAGLLACHELVCTFVSVETAADDSNNLKVQVTADIIYFDIVLDSNWMAGFGGQVGITADIYSYCHGRRQRCY